MKFSFEVGPIVRDDGERDAEAMNDIVQEKCRGDFGSGVPYCLGLDPLC